MKIMTFNIQHGLDYKNQRINLDLFAETIRKCGADVCGLNEVYGKGTGAEFNHQAKIIGNNLGYNYYFAEAIKIDNTDPYGNAFLSRYPVKSSETVFIPQLEDGKYHERRCIIKSVIDVEGKDICVLVTHMGLNDAERQNAVKTVCELVDKTDLPVILMGDFNAQPDDKVLSPIFERMSDTDELYGENNNFTWASYDPQCKIDYIFYKGLKCTAVTVIKEIVSDHFPVIADFEVI